jgi:ABC-type transport system involved in multi-copper enzyme maturation permease subunit
MTTIAGFDTLPDRLGPVVAKELRQGLRRATFVAPFLAVQALAALATWLEFQTGAHTGNSHPAFMNIHMLFASGPFWLAATTVCMVLMPLAGLQLMTGELDSGNHELLHMAGLSRWQIVRGKFLALWGLCALTFLSMLPYLVVRYFVGGIEWTREATCAATLLGGAALMAAGAIGASGFRNTAARVGVLLLFLASTAISGAIAMLSGMVFATFIHVIFYHINALGIVVCFVIIGLGLARGRLRHAHMPYEARQSTVLLLTLAALPFVTAIAMVMTCALGVIAPVLAALIALRRDRPFSHGRGHHALPPAGPPPPLSGGPSPG